MAMFGNGGPVTDVLLSPIIGLLCVWMVVGFVASVLFGETGWKWAVVKPMRFLGRQLGNFLEWLSREGAKLVWSVLTRVGRLTWMLVVRGARALWRRIATQRRPPAPGGAPLPPP